MLATDAYYLLSPLNLLLCLFPNNYLPAITLIIICIKFGLSGLSAFFVWQKKFQINNNYILATSVAYSLSGYMIANYFNLMWLDTIILLPLLVQAIDHTIAKQKDHLILITFLCWITNFYTGYMALFFGLIYYISQLAQTSRKINFKKNILSYLSKSILGSLAAGFILIPVFFELIKNPAISSANWSLDFQYNPSLIIDKLISGSYNFHEMQEGMPNIYTTSMVLFTAFSYFISKKITWRDKIINGIVLSFLTLSLSFTPFVLLWHLFKFPIWYPGRFSFVIIFFICNLALQWLKVKESLDFKLRITLFSLAIFISTFWTITEKQVTFINNTNLIISILLVALAIIFYFFIWQKTRWTSFIFFIVVTFELIINLVLSLNNISFQKNTNFINFQSNVQQVTNYLSKNDPGLYRTEKTFSRSDNDPFTGKYNGVSNFNSVTNNAVIEFLNKIGYQTNSNSYTNNGGTIITDSLLGIKYYIQPNFDANMQHISDKMVFNNQIARSDIDYYFLKKKFKQLSLFENYSALPLIFVTNTNTSPKLDDNPLQNQLNLLNSIVDKHSEISELVYLPNEKLNNAKKSRFNNFLIKQNNQSASAEYTINTNPRNTYYLYLPKYLTNNDIGLFVNNQEYDLSTRDEQNRLINLRMDNDKLNISIDLKQSNINLDEIKLYAINVKKFTKLIQQFKKSQPHMTQKSNFVIYINKFKTNSSSILRSSIPYSSNWFIFDNGKQLKRSKFAGAFLQAPLSKGIHQIKLIYIPLALIVGTIISIISLILIKIFYL